jgi:ATP-dependent protease ClpP protease subunit
MIWGGEATGKVVPPTNEDHKLPPGGKVTASEETNHLWFYKYVTDESVQEMVSALHEMVIKARKASEAYNIEYGQVIEPPPLHLHIHSYGGETFAGFAAADAILSCPLPVHTHIEGCAASAATIFSVMGAHRTIGPNSFILIHQLSSVFWGKYEEFKDEMKNHDLVMARLRAIYAERSKLKKAEVSKILKHDLWFDANKALKSGLVDEIR